MRSIRTWDYSKLSLVKHLLLVFLLSTGCVQAVAAVDISNPTKLMFVGDRTDNLIDVISLDDSVVVYRIETSIHPDHIIVTPFAPILVYTNTASKKVVFYDLKKQQETRTLELPISPRHVVLDTTGAKIGISDDVDGGFVLLHAYSRSIQFALEDFPATADVLFDPNDVDIYYSNNATGSMGLLDTNTQRTYEMSLTDEPGQLLTAPSRSIDGRYIYVANVTAGEVYSLNAYSKIIFNTFEIGGKPARPYTTPEGTFLYMMDEDSGRLVTVEQQGFTEYADSSFDRGVDLVAVGRFDRMNLFLSSANKRWYIYDNVAKAVIKGGEFLARPVGALGAADGKTAYVAFADAAQVAVIDLEKQILEYIPATENGSGAFTIGLSNNVCH
jgi:DNA-binding beta-propeller fold protein YncE